MNVYIVVTSILCLFATAKAYVWRSARGLSKRQEVLQDAIERLYREMEEDEDLRSYCDVVQVLIEDYLYEQEDGGTATSFAKKLPELIESFRKNGLSEEKIISVERQLRAIAGLKEEK